MHTTRLRLALALSLLMVLLGLNAGCANLPSFLKRLPTASPSPAASEEPGEGDTPQDIEGHVGNSTATQSL